ncbi:MAG: hypothetical protein RL204_826 [Bacteroidota bacterium]
MRNYYLLFTIRLIGLVGFISLLTGCEVLEPTGYRMTTQNIPLLEEAGEVQVHGALGLNHVEGIFAVSPINHVGIIGSRYANSTRGKTDEIGLGLYYKFKNNFLLESYATIGRSDFSAMSDIEGDGTDFFVDYRTRTTNDFKYSARSVQLNLGYIIDRGAFSVSTKFTRANYDYYMYSKEVYSEGLMENPHVVESYFFNSFENKQFHALTIAPTFSFKQGLFYFQTQLVFTNFIGNEKPYEPNGRFIPKAIWSTSVGIDIKTKEWFKELKAKPTL